MIYATRSFAAVFAGLMLISFVSEGIEFLLVAFIHGSPTSVPEVYLEIRNRPLILAIKFIYNNFAAFAGGYAAAWIAGRAHIWPGTFLAVLQMAGLVYGMTASPYANTTPMWAWVGLCATMPPFIVIGSWFRRSRMREHVPIVRN